MNDRQPTANYTNAHDSADDGEGEGDAIGSNGGQVTYNYVRIANQNEAAKRRRCQSMLLSWLVGASGSWTADRPKLGRLSLSFPNET